MKQVEEEQYVVVELFCSGCTQRIGYTRGDTQKRAKVYCSIPCMLDYDRDPREDRNALWRALVNEGWSPIAVARMAGVAHSLVYKTLKRG